MARYCRSFDKRLKVLEGIADDANQDTPNRLKALELMGKYTGLAAASVRAELSGAESNGTGPNIKVNVIKF